MQLHVHKAVPVSLCFTDIPVYEAEPEAQLDTGNCHSLGISSATLEKPNNINGIWHNGTEAKEVQDRETHILNDTVKYTEIHISYNGNGVAKQTDLF